MTRLPGKSCSHKRRYPKKKQAAAAREDYWRDFGPVRMDIYFCGFCGGWHLGKSKGGKRPPPGFYGPVLPASVSPSVR